MHVCFVSLWEYVKGDCLMGTFSVTLGLIGRIVTRLRVNSSEISHEHMNVVITHDRKKY